MVCWLEPETSQDGLPGLAGTFQVDGKVPWRLGLSVPMCKMYGLESINVSHRGALGESHRQKGVLCLCLLSSTSCWRSCHGELQRGTGSLLFATGFRVSLLLKDAVND